MKTEFTTSELELRSTDEGPRLTGIILQEGRAATADEPSCSHSAL